MTGGCFYIGKESFFTKTYNLMQGLWMFFFLSEKSQDTLDWRLFFSFFIVVLDGVYFGMYKCSYNIYNISYLNSFPSSFSFIPSSPFLEQFQQVFKSSRLLPKGKPMSLAKACLSKGDMTISTSTWSVLLRVLKIAYILSCTLLSRDTLWVFYIELTH
jgi:hypothetical protein